jgi:XTP/dITP diphosphohydrolase
VSVAPDGPLVLVMASANPDKAAEIRDLLTAELGGEVVIEPRPVGVPDVVEDGATLEDNARLKAVALSEATGRAAVADDTGLEVDALDGAPGVYTARFAGEAATYAENVAHLLAELDRVGATGRAARTARFHTVALVRFPDGGEVIGHGTVEGAICAAPVGEAGFGYDPVFVPDDGDGRTFAQMSTSEKHGLSHRGRAFRSLAAALRR